MRAMDHQQPIVRRVLLLLVLLAPAATLSNPPPAGGDYRLRDATTGSGGTSASATFQVSGTLGQAQVISSSAGELELRGGFWVRSGSTDRVFSSGFE